MTGENLIFSHLLLLKEGVWHLAMKNQVSLLIQVRQDEDVELGLAKKYLLLTHEEGKNPQEGSGPEPGSKEEGHGDKQEGGTVVELCLKQNLNSNPETGSRTTMQTGTRTNSGTGP